MKGVPVPMKRLSRVSERFNSFKSTREGRRVWESEGGGSAKKGGRRVARALSANGRWPVASKKKLPVATGGKMGKNGKNGENGGKWGSHLGKNGEKWGKIRKNGEKWGAHFSPFFPIFLHFS